MSKYIIFSIISGLLLVAGWPTLGMPLFLFVGFVPLLICEHEISQKILLRKRGLKIFGLSFLTFLIWNAIVIWWLHYAKQYNDLGELQNSWVAYLFPVFINSLLMSFVFQIYHWTKVKVGNHLGIIFLPVIWMAFEKFHLNWELAWPWFNLGNGFADYYKWVQWYEYTGTFGGTLWIWIVNLIIFYFYTAYKNTNRKSFLIKLIIYPIVWIAVPIGVSYIIYSNYEEKGEELSALVLQPALDPYVEKYTKDKFEIVDDLMDLIDRYLRPTSSFIVAPETAFPGPGPGLNIDRLEDDLILDSISYRLGKYSNMTFISGVELMRFYPYEQLASETATRYGKQDMWFDVYNSAIQLNNKDSISYYHKSKLVVGVEHFPYAKYLKPILGEALLNFGGTVRTHGIQKERSVFRNSKNKAVIAPVICYESIFGEYNTEYVQAGANVFFVMTNDSWWGRSNGHKQLFLYGNLRSIENRRAIVRSANSGISAFINQKGDVISQIPYGLEGGLTGSFKMNEELTFYTKYGDYLARIAIFLAGIIFAYALSVDLIQRKK